MEEKKNKAIKEACNECGYLHPKKHKFYKCFAGNCPAKRIHEEECKKHGVGQLDDGEIYLESD